MIVVCSNWTDHLKQDALEHFLIPLREERIQFC